MKKISAPDRRKAAALIQHECCNNISGDCIACDTKCAQIQRLKTANNKEQFICRWFVDAVLPLDKDLHMKLLSPQNLVRCAQCGAMFAPGSNSAKYCASCASILQKKYKREYAQKKRNKQ